MSATTAMVNAGVSICTRRRDGAAAASRLAAPAATAVWAPLRSMRRMPFGPMKPIAWGLRRMMPFGPIHCAGWVPPPIRARTASCSGCRRLRAIHSLRDHVGRYRSRCHLLCHVLSRAPRRHGRRHELLRDELGNVQYLGARTDEPSSIAVHCGQPTATMSAWVALISAIRMSGMRRLPGMSVIGAPPPPPQQRERKPDRSISTTLMPMPLSALRGPRTRRCSGPGSTGRGRSRCRRPFAEGEPARRHEVGDEGAVVAHRVVAAQRRVFVS